MLCESNDLTKLKSHLHAVFCIKVIRIVSRSHVAGASGKRVSNRQVRLDGGGARTGGDPALQAGQEYDRAPRGHPVGAAPTSTAAPPSSHGKRRKDLLTER